MFQEIVRQAVLEMEAEAEVFLYGSRVRGEVGPESDWDFLVLLPGEVDFPRKARLRRRLYEIEWETGCVINVLVHGQDEWRRFPLNTMPLWENIKREGCRV
ncbi:MAG: nucleotidyltransferase domain-containing protein [Acidobacteria bacterium]|nr:nucleotidyltransferase domain-containing protein [Acidobacteriota bacterium]